MPRLLDGTRQRPVRQGSRHLQQEQARPTGHAKPNVLEPFLREALDLGADLLEVEYRDGYDEVVACIGSIGRVIARLRSACPQAAALRRGLYDSQRRPLRFTMKDREYTMRAEVHDEFGEDVFRVELGRSNNRMQLTRSAHRQRKRGPRS